MAEVDHSCWKVATSKKFKSFLFLGMRKTFLKNYLWLLKVKFIFLLVLDLLIFYKFLMNKRWIVLLKQKDKLFWFNRLHHQGCDVSKLYETSTVPCTGESEEIKCENSHLRQTLAYYWVWRVKRERTKCGLEI